MPTVNVSNVASALNITDASAFRCLSKRECRARRVRSLSRT